MALEAVYFVDKNVYIVSLPYGELDINGEEVVVDYSHPKRELTKEQVFNIRHIYYADQAVHYVNDNGDILSAFEYQEKRRELAHRGSYDEEEDTLIFEDLEDEYAYKKFIKTWKPVLEKRKLYQKPYSIVVMTAPYDTGSPFIKSLAVDQSKCSYMVLFDKKQALMDFVKTYCNKHNIPCIVSDSLTSIKIHTDYLIGNTPNELSDCKNLGVQTLIWEDACKAQSELFARLETRIKFLHRKNAKLPIDIDVYYILDKLNTVRNDLIDVRSLVKTENEYRRAKKVLTELIAELEKLVIDG